ncbi:TetR/AcrR family transcriptional regulator [Streptomyces antimicrobicus]|uniref:TetR/AcrR family transcriptional regulator n=1 Tax=Streptomyces antimicrobicus TaxID=2883108 RepID=A0ABS8BBI2_9ACTN|nr:TetR/AcrR family transcriptional regulator [Streptomyces antimicrobicus]MCB5181993.1 TetR/AcrR family transcriptional regulator [Streptomyces antimicrobicus]
MAKSPQPGTRERIVHAASLLMQRQGYEGTGIKQIAQEAEATLGSVYHFFPGGKQAVGVAAVQHADQEFADLLSAALSEEADPAKAIAACARALACHLRDSGWVDGCPISATALETTGRVPAIEQAVNRAFQHWRDIVADTLRGAGFRESDAHDLATTVISTLEGAELTAQVFKSETPLTVAGEHLARLINSYKG